jgi:hypothetical protein
MPVPLSCSGNFDPLGEFRIDETGELKKPSLPIRHYQHLSAISLEFSKFVVQTNSQDTVTFITLLKIRVLKHQPLSSFFSPSTLKLVVTRPLPSSEGCRPSNFDDDGFRNLGRHTGWG